jgi:hypothetical protein
MTGRGRLFLLYGRPRKHKKDLPAVNVNPMMNKKNIHHQFAADDEEKRLFTANVKLTKNN